MIRPFLQFFRFLCYIYFFFTCYAFRSFNFLVMLRNGVHFCSRLNVWPSTSSAFMHTSIKICSIPNTKLHDHEVSVTPPKTLFERKMRKRRVEEVNLLIPKTPLALWTKMESKGLLSAYLQLSKYKLTMLITSTAIVGFLMAPGSISLMQLAGCAVGTALLSCSANACNQLLEAPYDAQMKRTQNRVLVIHRFSPLHALSFAGFAGTAGIGALYMAANPLSASLGVLNLILYVGIYTPLKRAHIACTWAGALVGSIPPLMGYASATGTIDAAALCLAAILYSWQFPHFNGLSWNLRGDYSQAGYRVMCVTNERLCRITSIRHSFALIGLCSFVAPMTNLTTITFGFDSLPVNLYMCLLAYRFYKAPDAQNSRRLFLYRGATPGFAVIPDALHHHLAFYNLNLFIAIVLCERSNKCK
ncbi:protoheme IX farnesyltransferase [Dictyocaulus viviparus]|uniref:Protoheme IX farnesyltransferase, mitochondrial n=1 Tax=Dictyocaulus viviparus TaxID=29172 RepID=A0A0D8XHK9_DICVI|nr:protoheme IX farnesyltransferase [Dictyocaulus viviparus]